MHSDLIDRLTLADGPSRELDAWVAIATNDMPPRMNGAGADLRAHRNGHVSSRKFGSGWNTDRFTASMDAAAALAGRLFPDCRWEIKTTDFKPSAALLTKNDLIHAHAATPAIAMVVAILKTIEGLHHKAISPSSPSHG